MALESLTSVLEQGNETLSSLIEKLKKENVEISLKEATIRKRILDATTDEETYQRLQMATKLAEEHSILYDRERDFEIDDIFQATEGGMAWFDAYVYVKSRNGILRTGNPKNKEDAAILKTSPEMEAAVIEAERESKKTKDYTPSTELLQLLKPIKDNKEVNVSLLLDEYTQYIRCKGGHCLSDALNTKQLLEQIERLEHEALPALVAVNPRIQMREGDYGIQNENELSESQFDAYVFLKMVPFILQTCNGSIVEEHAFLERARSLIELLTEDEINQVRRGNLLVDVLNKIDATPFLNEYSKYIKENKPPKGTVLDTIKSLPRLSSLNYKDIIGERRYDAGRLKITQEFENINAWIEANRLEVDENAGLYKQQLSTLVASIGDTFDSLLKIRPQLIHRQTTNAELLRILAIPSIKRDLAYFTQSEFDSPKQQIEQLDLYVQTLDDLRNWFQTILKPMITRDTVYEKVVKLLDLPLSPENMFNVLDESSDLYQGLWDSFKEQLPEFKQRLKPLYSPSEINEKMDVRKRRPDEQAVHVSFDDINIKKVVHLLFAWSLIREIPPEASDVEIRTIMTSAGRAINGLVNKVAQTLIKTTRGGNKTLKKTKNKH